MKDETENISKKHGELAEALLFQVEEPLNNFLKETKKNRTTVKKLFKIFFLEIYFD